MTGNDHALEGYCFWLVPSAKENESYQSLIRRLADIKDSPVFEPHITLLHPIRSTFPPSTPDVAALVAKLEATIKDGEKTGPFTLSLDAPVAGNHYYQCVLTPVDMSGEADTSEGQNRLLALRAAVEDAFDEHPPLYYPHLSLVYGDLDDETKRQVAEVAGQDEDGWPRRVTIEEAAVVCVKGTAPEWEVVARVKV